MTADLKHRRTVMQWLWRYGPVLLWMAVLFIASAQSSLPSADEPLLDKILKKYGHITAYAILMWLLLRAMYEGKHLSARQSLLAFAILLAYAASDEFHQSFVPGRTSKVTDVIIFDFLGGCAGWVTFQRIRLQRLQSQHAWLYGLLFIACLALLFMLNLPYPEQAPQEPARLLTDAWFIWGFNYFGMLLMPMAALLIDDARHRNMRWWAYTVPYFVVGVLALSVYLARRQDEAVAAPSGKSISVPRWLWWSLIPITLLLSITLLPRGSWVILSDTMHHNVGLWFMWLDIALNHILSVPLVYSDMTRRGIQPRWPWLAFIAITGPIGLAVYMAHKRQT